MVERNERKKQNPHTTPKNTRSSGLIEFLVPTNQEGGRRRGGPGEALHSLVVAKGTYDKQGRSHRQREKVNMPKYDTSNVGGVAYGAALTVGGESKGKHDQSETERKISL